jgi:nucleoside 2-deoxyribosyltransferase
MNSQLKPVTVYLASALSNADLNSRIARSVALLGHHTYLPQDDPVNKSEGVPGESIAARNREQIERCDCLIAVYHKMGLDTSWEIGYARGLQKPCLLLCAGSAVQTARLSPMPFFSVNGVIVVPDWDGQVDVYAPAIDRALKTVFSGK